MASFHELKWQCYFGEDPEAAESEDEDYACRPART